jgi:hypothetical protein
MSQLYKEVEGLFDRFRYRYSDGLPAAYVGETIFEPETTTFTEPHDGASVPVSYVVRDGVAHSVPIKMSGPGVFMARYLSVQFYQRVWGGDGHDGGFGNREYWYQIPVKKFVPSDFAENTTTTINSTRKFSLANDLTSNQWSSDRYLVGVNYFWNLIDGDSGRRYGEDWIPDMALLPQGYQNEVNGNLLEFPVPWLFERAGVLDFQFQLVTPILQLAPSNGTFPFQWDDREEGDTVRNQSVKVRVELHGTKFYTGRDLVLREAV